MSVRETQRPVDHNRTLSFPIRPLSKEILSSTPRYKESDMSSYKKKHRADPKPYQQWYMYKKKAPDMDPDEMTGRLDG